jgi:ribosomal protein S18 acetylase RimI-like enzyme
VTTPPNAAESSAELLSLYVLEAYRHQGIGTTLVKQLQQLVGQPFINPPAIDTL